MTKPIPDKAEIALEYPDKHYVGTFERSSRFEAHLDPTGIALILERSGAEDGAVAGVVGIRRGAISGNMKVQFQAARSIG